jgi:hypothetical protein
MALLSMLARLIERWASMYSGMPMLQSATTFAHVAGLLLGGGFAIATDAATVRAAGANARMQRRQLRYIHRIHFPVLVGLGITFFSGVLMFAADLETFVTSPAFWTKMSLVALLLANGVVMARTEAALRAGPSGDKRGWRRLRRGALCSFALWFAAALAGTMLVTAAD